MHKNKVLSSAVVLFVFFAIGTVWALNADYNRPNPLIDYVAQEIAIYDTRYDNLGEDDCRACHGNSLADRHHYTNIVLRDKLCTPCHEVIPEPPGVVVIRDCTTAGCHSWLDVGPLDEQGDGFNGWHHSTNLSESENCVACHSANIVAEILPDVIPFAQYPPSVVTPTPFSCENCHWDQEIVDTGWSPGDPDPVEGAAGHPSTYDHYDAWGNFAGYYEYGKPILGNFDTHHMGFKGNVASECYKCHANDPDGPSWDPYDPELIRYCEICHDVATLHTIFPHVGPAGTGNEGAYEGWVATGFHAGGGGSIPGAYYGNNANSISNGDSFLQNEMCFGCHGDAVPEYEGELTSKPEPTAMEPLAVCPLGQVEITGSYFGIELTPERGVRIKEGTTWVDVPIYSWTDTRIVFEVPAWTFTPGNHKVKVYTEAGANKTLNKLTIMDCPTPFNLSPTSGACKTILRLDSGTGDFGKQDNGAPSGTDGRFQTVVLVGSQGTYVAGPDAIKKWGINTVKAKLYVKADPAKTGWFIDEDGDYLYDAGETEVVSCEGFNLGNYAVYLVSVFYEDSDVSLDYSNGDTVYQLVSSDFKEFELTNMPWIAGVNPKAFVVGDRVKIIGANFGVEQGTGQVYIGRKGQYNPSGGCFFGYCFDGSPTGGKLQPDRKIKMWSDTKIKVKIKFNQTKWAGKKRYIWVVKDGMVSNAKKVRILN